MTKRPSKQQKLRSYLFSCGDSTAGAVGFCARVRAHSRQAALQLLREALPQSLPAPDADDSAVEYLNVYFNADAVTVDDIEEEEIVDADDQ